MSLIWVFEVWELLQKQLENLNNQFGQRAALWFVQYNKNLFLFTDIKKYNIKIRIEFTFYITFGHLFTLQWFRLGSNITNFHKFSKNSFIKTNILKILPHNFWQFFGSMNIFMLKVIFRFKFNISHI